MQQVQLQQKVAVWIAIVFCCLSNYAAISSHSANSSRREGSSALALKLLQLLGELQCGRCNSKIIASLMFEHLQKFPCARTPSLLITTISLFLSIKTQIVARARMKALRESLCLRIHSIHFALVAPQLGTLCRFQRTF